MTNGKVIQDVSGSTGCIHLQKLKQDWLKSGPGCETTWQSWACHLEFHGSEARGKYKRKQTSQF